MTKQDLARRMSTEAGISGTEAVVAIAATFEAIAAELVAGGDVALTGFGKFSVSDRAARQGRNPQTGEAIQIKPSRAAKFSPASALKTALKS
ncbi:MAG TPA: HU family DNA-binding protein [Frankiaceae bacterium]|jgi:DNA-binding protein HU-beta|nr:HU family DNA-binding protein [Frankiaceae bacterium]